MAAKQQPNKRILATFAVAHVAAMALTWRDLRARPGRQVRGHKTIWRVASGLNTLGSVAYWLFGRRPPA